MIKILITGKNSFIGTSVEDWLNKDKNKFCVDTVDTRDHKWDEVDFSKYDVVFHVAGIAHVDAKKSMEKLYYKVNRDLTLEIARKAKNSGVKQFVFMSSMIVFHESKSLKSEVITKNTKPCPNGFYGDSKLQAEKGLLELENDNFKVTILRPPMIYGSKSRGNFLRLLWLSRVTPIFPNLHNKRSMLYIDNLCEFVKQVIIRGKRGIFHPQNNELADTLDIVRYFSKAAKHNIWISSVFNIFVYLFSPILNPLNKMFATYYYDDELSKVDFEYCVVTQNESFEIINNEYLTKIINGD